MSTFIIFIALFYCPITSSIFFRARVGMGQFDRGTSLITTLISKHRLIIVTRRNIISQGLTSFIWCMKIVTRFNTISCKDRNRCYLGLCKLELDHLDSFPGLLQKFQNEVHFLLHWCYNQMEFDCILQSNILQWYHNQVFVMLLYIFLEIELPRFLCYKVLQSLQHSILKENKNYFFIEG